MDGLINWAVLLDSNEWQVDAMEEIRGHTLLWNLGWFKPNISRGKVCETQNQTGRIIIIRKKNFQIFE